MTEEPQATSEGKPWLNAGFLPWSWRLPGMMRLPARVCQRRLPAAKKLESATGYDVLIGATADHRPVWITVRVPDADDD